MKFKKTPQNCTPFSTPEHSDDEHYYGCETPTQLDNGETYLNDEEFSRDGYEFKEGEDTETEVDEILKEMTQYDSPIIKPLKRSYLEEILNAPRKKPKSLNIKTEVNINNIVRLKPKEYYLLEENDDEYDIWLYEEEEEE